MSFGGTTYDPAEDKERLTKQLGRVYEVMSGGEWLSLEQIQRRTRWLRPAGEDTQAAVSARLRDLRKSQFGGYCVERQRVEGGLWKYRLRSPARDKKQGTLWRVL